MDRLMALQAFARVVELGGFTKASDSLQMPKTSVSDLVQSLEKHLGARLLQRTTRRVTVTAEGAAFYEHCVQILADLDEAERQSCKGASRRREDCASTCPARLRGSSSSHDCRRFSRAIPI